MWSVFFVWRGAFPVSTGCLTPANVGFMTKNEYLRKSVKLTSRLSQVSYSQTESSSWGQNHVNRYFFIMKSESSWIIYHRQPFFIPHLFGYWLNCGLKAVGSACSQGSISILFLLIIGTKNVNTSLISILQLEDVQKASDGDSHFFPVLLFTRTPAIVSSKMGARISQLSSCGALLGAVVIPCERLVRN